MGTRPMFFYIAQIAMSAVVVLVSTTLVTFGKLVSPVVAAVFLISLISSFIVTARLLYHTYEEAVQCGRSMCKKVVQQRIRG